MAIRRPPTPNAAPSATVLIVEGEKCADAGAELPDLVCVSWPGGGKAVDKTDLYPLAGRKVILWPDCDAQRDKKTGKLLPEEKQPGVKTMRRLAEMLHFLGCKVWIVRIPPPGEGSPGWDIADAVAEGLTGEALAEWIRNRLEPYGAAGDAVSPSPETAGAGESEKPPSNWEEALLMTKQGRLENCTMNIHDILLNIDVWKGVIAYDTFAQRTVKLRPPPYADGAAGVWDDRDDSQTDMWLTRHWRFAPGIEIVARAVETLAKEHCFNPVQDYLRGLVWDNIERIDHWLIDFCGVPDTPYARRVGR